MGFRELFNTISTKKMLRRKIMAYSLLAAVSAETWSKTAEVCLLGFGVVFAGLVILIGLVYLLNLICDKTAKDRAPKKAEAPAAVVTAKNDVIPNRKELVAAVCAAIAEEEGTDISAIRVVSIKKV